MLRDHSHVAVQNHVHEHGQLLFITDGIHILVRLLVHQCEPMLERREGADVVQRAYFLLFQSVQPAIWSCVRDRHKPLA